MDRRGLFAGAALALLTVAAGCASGPIEGARLEALRREVALAKPPAVLVRSVGPRALVAGGPESEAVMPLVSGGRTVAKFELYDLYFKTVFLAVEELRGLGLEVVASPEIWASRAEALAFEAGRLAPDAIDLQLARLGAQEEIPELYRLSPAQKVALVVSRRELLSARTALPLAMRAKKPAGREIRDAFFQAEGAPTPPLALDLEVLEAEATAEEGGLGAGRTARVKLRATWTARKETRLLAEGTYEAAASAEGTGARLVSGRFTLTLGEDEPLERALRRALRAAVADALPRLR
jgi:hypothetical protein